MYKRQGLEVARRLRAGPPIAILMLTARDTVTDRVAGLEGGADDYLSKPFAFEELLARVHVQPVSYTHLDVYKRQVYRSLPSRRNDFFK